MLREFLRQSPSWVKFQEINREGWRNAYTRVMWQGRILKTPKISTAQAGKSKMEVRVLTWRRGWLDALWCLKSFFVHSEVDFPVVIHDGGLEPWQYSELTAHFPNVRIISRKEADEKVEGELVRRGLKRSLEYRRLNIATLKVWDFFLLSEADNVISLDSDIVFFERPTQLLNPSEKNLFNQDMQYAYSMDLDELEKELGVRPPPLINSGLSLVARESMNFEKIESWLENPKLFADKWVTEQTLHALNSTVYGVDLLPKQYFVSTKPGMPPDAICKHYPGFFRPLLYSEGMRTVWAQNVLGSKRF